MVDNIASSPSIGGFLICRVKLVKGTNELGVISRSGMNTHQEARVHGDARVYKRGIGQEPNLG